jgi:DNA-binding response OmpR family regulator
MRPVIFVVDGDPHAIRLLRSVLEAENFAVRTFAAAGEVLAQTARPDLFLLERDLSDGDGLELCRDIRKSLLWADLPVIFVSERNSEGERIAGLRLADDYIAKPFSTLELVARTRAVLRRTRHRRAPSRLMAGDLELDSDSLTVQIRGRSVRMTVMEFRLLAYLASNLERAFSREQLLNAVWDARFVTPRTVDVHVRRLREKIEPQPETPRYLQTIRGRGYRLVPGPFPPGSAHSFDRAVFPPPAHVSYPIFGDVEQ